MLAILYPQAVVTADRWCPGCAEVVAVSEDERCPWCECWLEGGDGDALTHAEEAS